MKRSEKDRFKEGMNRMVVLDERAQVSAPAAA